MGAPTRLHYGAPDFSMDWAPGPSPIWKPWAGTSVKSSGTSPKSLAPPAMMRRETSPTNKPTQNWLSSSGLRRRSCSKNYCRCAGRSTPRSSGKDAIAILPAAPVRHRNGDIEYAYRQDSHFYYLSGFPEPDAVAVLLPGRPQAEYLLFVREHDALRESWDGARAGTEGAVERYAADDAFPIEDIDEILPGLMEQRARIFYSMGTHLDFDPRILSWVNGLKVLSRQGAGGSQEFVALNHVLDDMRLYKSRPEQASLRRAAQIAVGAHRRAIRFARPGRMEYEVMAEVLHEFRSHNADVSYQPIVGGGANACVMHYRDNDQPLCDGDLLLLDAGCEHDYYASDITRTFPVSGKFTAVQRAVYDVVLEAQLAAIDKVRSGNHWNEPHEAAVRVVTQGLAKLGLLKGAVPRP